MANAKTKTKTKSAPAKRAAQNTSPVSAKKTSKQAVQESKDGSMLEVFFIDSLKDIYWAEKALTKALPKMSKNATTPELKKAFDKHLQETQKQIEKLEQVFQKMGKKAQAKKCDAMQGLVEESESIIAETKDDTSTRDAALIIAAQKVEHYEIASYGGMVQLAKTMKRTDVAKILESILAEEKKTDELLTKIAEQGGINEQASEEPEAEKGSLKESIMSVFS